VPFAPPSSDESAPADKMFGSMTPKDWKEMNEDAKEFSEDFKNTEADGLKSLGYSDTDVPASSPGESTFRDRFDELTPEDLEELHKESDKFAREFKGSELDGLEDFEFPMDTDE
ncbi:MAG: hypothetical protein OXC44_05420, partial [Proteobacteria bacterium]|nr:hypothetical protein [Pseudomonadota bacterium]